METQDHKKPISSGHGGNHVCNKCGWPFPNAHPSSRHRRAHRKVCGTIEGFKLDNLNDLPGVKVHGEGSDGEHGSDDEHKTPSEKVVDNGIIRKSSSGVGSRSSRSEDEMFADAVTEFNESPALVTSQGSGGLERYYSMQNANEPEESKAAEENPVVDYLSIPETDLLKDDQLQFLQTFEGEDKIEMGVVLNDSSTYSTLQPVPVSVKNENAVQQNVLQFSELSIELNVAAGGGEEILSSEDPSGLSSLNNGIGEEIAVSKVANEEILDTVSVGMVSQKGQVLIDEEGNIERSYDEESPEKDNIANVDEVDSIGDFYTPVREVQATDSGNRNSRKSEAFEERNSNVGADYYIHSVAVPDALPLPEHPALEPEGINHERGKLHNLKVEDSTLSAEDPEDNRPGAMKESDTGFDMTETVDGHNFSLDDTDLAKNVPLMEDVHDQGSDVGVHELGNEEIGALRNKSVENDEVSCSEVQKPIPLAEKVLSDGNAMDGGHIQETTSNVDAEAMNIVIDDHERFLQHESDSNKVSEGDSTVRDWFGELAINKVLSQVKEQMSIHRSNYMVETQGECLAENGREGGVKSDVCAADSLEVGEHVESSLRSSSGLDDCSSKREGDKVTEPHVAVSGVNTVVDTGSQADSLDGNWGSVSVMSAASDAQPATDTPLDYSQAMAGEETVSLERNHVAKNQNAQSQTSLEQEVGIKQMEKTSEIQTSIEQQGTSNELPIKSDEEIIEKVEHTALKTLLGEATAKSRAESPLHHNYGSTPETKTVETPVTNNSSTAKIQDALLSSKNPEKEAAQEEMGKELNSPTRYPVNMKSEKRRTKSRPYWAPFLCCSSVNAM